MREAARRVSGAWAAWGSAWGIQPAFAEKASARLADLGQPSGLHPSKLFKTDSEEMKHVILHRFFGCRAQSLRKG